MAEKTGKRISRILRYLQNFFIFLFHLHDSDRFP
jgi:hypothetical protein